MNIYRVLLIGVFIVSGNGCTSTKANYNGNGNKEARRWFADGIAIQESNPELALERLEKAIRISLSARKVAASNGGGKWQDTARNSRSQS